MVPGEGRKALTCGLQVKYSRLIGYEFGSWGVFTGFAGSGGVRDESCNHAGSVFGMGLSVYGLGCDLLVDAWDA